MEHPITPPPELIEQWRTAPEYAKNSSKAMLVSMTISRLQEIATQAARWGADQELEACCRWIDVPIGLDDCRPGEESKLLRAARRPKSLGLKERALKALDSASYQPGSDFKQIDPARLEVIRRALECLPDESSPKP